MPSNQLLHQQLLIMIKDYYYTRTLSDQAQHFWSQNTFTSKMTAKNKTTTKVHQSRSIPHSFSWQFPPAVNLVRQWSLNVEMVTEQKFFWKFQKYYLNLVRTSTTNPSRFHPEFLSMIHLIHLVDVLCEYLHLTDVFKSVSSICPSAWSIVGCGIWRLSEVQTKTYGQNYPFRGKFWEKLSIFSHHF